MDLSPLTTWFTYNKRDLPWRQDPTPYQVWISEVMLQQTQVDVVIAYYYKWMKLFPTVEALAKADIQQVIKAWEGLGYYSRARRLHAAALVITEKFGGEIPQDEGSLETIPGIGPYTKGAILSFAFHQKKAAVDGNVMRVISRLFNLQENISKPKTVTKIFSLVEAILPSEKPWETMEALIELGALVCKKKPECKKCPLMRQCNAFKYDRQYELPIKTPSKASLQLERNVFIILFQNDVLLRKETKRGSLMQDLYEFPFLDRNSSHRVQTTFYDMQLEMLGELDMVKHGFTRFIAKLFPAIFMSHEKSLIAGYEWIECSQLKHLPFSSGHKRILMQVESYLQRPDFSLR